MSLNSIPRPGAGRIVVALLAMVPAAMAYPWQSTRDYWLIGIAAVVVIVLFGWWRGLHFTTIVRRRLAMMRRRRSGTDPATEVRTTALLRIGPPAPGLEVLPLPLIAGYLDRYGIRADAVRITGHVDAAGERELWIGLTVSAAANLAALQARSRRIPLQQTAEVAARRLADHLREIGWDVGTVGYDDAPRLLARADRETWRCMRHGDSDYLAAYRVSVDAALPETLAAVWSHPARETWAALEIGAAGRPGGPPTVAVACAFRSDARPDGAAPLAGLTLQRGSQWLALAALEPSSTLRLDGPTDAPDGLLEGLVWPIPSAWAAHTSLTDAASRT
ncbi:type VII secretion protein EccE [Mycobacterium kansasii]|uniref:type VII secretion protein EccE n=1 Tax=Mycobacterium kansasii TaxID=1768 RepID=UPI0022B8509A|nr:type VII secretion protein EccE [Mycobacterium kansasii]